jgi:hypothetical protein
MFKLPGPRVAGLIALAAGTVLCACGGNNNATGAGTDPILTITNEWKDEANADHRFLLASGDDGKNAGSFTGQELLPDSTWDLAGNWENGKVDFTVNRAQPVTYTARFNQDSPTRLAFQSGGVSLVLIQNTGAPRTD